MTTLREDLDALSREVKAEIAKVAKRFREATDPEEKRRLETALEALEDEESDVLDLRLRFTQEQLLAAADALAQADLNLKREALRNVLRGLVPTRAPTPGAVAGAQPRPEAAPPAQPAAGLEAPEPATASPLASAPKIVVSERELDLLARVAKSEVGHFGKHGADQLEGGLAAVVDTIINRVAHPAFPTTFEGVVDQPKQFSAINALGTWTKLPEADTRTFNIVKRHVIDRCQGKASALEGATHFLNPHLSSPGALAEWGQHVVDHAVAVFGDDSRGDVHFHGFAPGTAPPPDYTLVFRGDVQPFAGDGTPHVAAGTPDTLVASAKKEWDVWGRSTWNLITRTRNIVHRDNEPEFSRYVLDNYCAVVNSHPPQSDIERDEYAWSAVAISFVLKQAGVTKDRFPFSESHSVYIRDSIKRKDAKDESAFYWGHRIDDPLAKPDVGDLVGYPRAKNLTREKALAFYDKTGRYNSHTDLVVAKRPGEIDVIGGNVSDSMTMKTLALADDGTIIDDTHFWFVVMKRVGG